MSARIARGERGEPEEGDDDVGDDDCKPDGDDDDDDGDDEVFCKRSRFMLSRPNIPGGKKVGMGVKNRRQLYW